MSSKIDMNIESPQEFKHIPVLFEETIDSLNIKPDGVYVDCTAGGGGHSEAILKRLSDGGKLISIDQDPDAIKACTLRLSKYPGSIILKGNFSEVSSLVKSAGYESVDGVLMDIGVSSHQLDTPERGFSYHYDAPLDMRMSQSGLSAADLVNSLSWQELAEIISRYGEDKSAVRIAKAIVSRRQENRIDTTLELAEIIKEAVPAAVRREGGHPARKTFQALRIAVNGELDVLAEGMKDAFELLNKGGRLSIITFHSLEDRMVKRQMASWCVGCTCPPDFPVCVCGKTPRGSLVYKKGLSASAHELAMNPRARSARLRVIEKL